MTSTALASDYVLPAAGWYEKYEHKWGTPLMPYIHSGEKLASYQEAKQDWKSARCWPRRSRRAPGHAASHVQGSPRRRAAAAHAVRRLHDGRHLHRTRRGKSGGDARHRGDQPDRRRVGEVKETGYARFTAVGRSGVSIGNACDIPADDTVSPFRYHVEKKQPYPTLTRRIQFYIDHPFYSSSAKRCRCTRHRRQRAATTR